MSQGAKTAKYAEIQGPGRALGRPRVSKKQKPGLLAASNHAEPSAIFSNRVYRGALPLSAEIANWLGGEIVSGRLSPGTRLLVRELSERLGVSVTPIREAFRLVGGEGLVELSSRRGAWVAKINTDEVEDIYECRAALSDLTARQCAARASDEELATLAKTASAMAEALRAGKTDKFFELNVRFHDLVLAASKNITLQVLSARLGRRTLQLQRLSLSLPGCYERSLKMHLNLVDALCARDGVRAGAILRETILASAAALIQHERDQNRHE